MRFLPGLKAGGFHAPSLMKEKNKKGGEKPKDRNKPGAWKRHGRRRRKEAERFITIQIAECTFVEYYMQSKTDGKSIPDLAREAVEWYARNYFPSDE